MSRRALVTGSLGFVGRVLTRRLREAGWEVLGTDLAPEAPEGAYRQCDLTDREQVRELVAWASPLDQVFHLAGVTFVPDAEREPTRAMRANYDATVYLMQALGELADSARVLHVSTSEVYGLPQRLPIDETHPVNPTNVYSISKAAADQFVRLPRGPNGPRVIVARPFNHSGPGQNASFVLSSFARQVARIELGLAEPVLRVGNLSAARDFLHVEDVVSAYLLLAEGGTTEDVYNICSGTSHTIQEAMEKLLSLSSMSIRWEVDPERWRESVCQEIRGSHERLTRDTGWEPRVTFGDLLKDILEYWRQRERTEV